jgi:uncharacterized protein with HEPN domain
VREPRVLLLDILAAIDDVLSFVEGGREAFMADRKTQAAVIRCFEIIGEASKGCRTQCGTKPRTCPGSVWEASAMCSRTPTIAWTSTWCGRS